MGRGRTSLISSLMPVLAGLAGCAGAAPIAQPVTIERPAFGGEAQFRGHLGKRNGCIVAVGGSQVSTVLFDPDVRLLDNGEGIFDPATRQSIVFGQAVTGGAAFLRERGRGWPISDIETFFGVSLPRGCPVGHIMRLHDLVTE